MKSKVDNGVCHSLSILKPPAGVFLLAALADTRRSGAGVGSNPLLLAGEQTSAGRHVQKPEFTVQSALSYCHFRATLIPKPDGSCRHSQSSGYICIVNIFKQACVCVCVCVGRGGRINDNNICGNEIWKTHLLRR